MSTVEEIEQAIRSLPPEQCLRVKAWLDEYHAGLWDAQMEADIRAGRLELLGDEALAELRAGQCTDL